MYENQLMRPLLVKLHHTNAAAAFANHHHHHHLLRQYAEHKIYTNMQR